MVEIFRKSDCSSLYTEFFMYLRNTVMTSTVLSCSAHRKVSMSKCTSLPFNDLHLFTVKYNPI